MWRLKESAENSSKAENALMLKRELESMAGRIPGIIRLEAGINFSDGPDAYDLVLVAEFGSKQDLEAYQTHAEHLRVISLLRPRRNSRIVVDYEV